MPTERNKTLTALANTEPVRGAQHARAQGRHWFLSESTWSPERVNAQRRQLLRADPVTAPDGHGVLVIDERGDRKDGTKTAHVGRQYIANLAKTDHGVVSVSSLWADEQVQYPLEVAPYTSKHWFAQGTADPAFRTKPQIAVELVERAVTAPWPFRAVVADACYGENATVHLGLHRLQVGCVVALTPAHAWWRPIDEPGSLQEIAAATPWYGPEQPGAWVRVVRHFRDGHTEDWWALDVIARPYGPDKTWRASVATTEPRHLPERMTWYLLTNLPAPGSARAATSPYAPAGVAEIVRLYGLRMGVEQSYKQVKQALGWAEYQVRSDLAMRRHWVLVWCAFAFCRWHLSHGAEAVPDWLAAADVLQQGAQVPGEAAGKGKKSRTNPQVTPFGVLAGSVAEGARVALSLISTSQRLAR